MVYIWSTTFSKYAGVALELDLRSSKHRDLALAINLRDTKISRRKRVYRGCIYDKHYKHDHSMTYRHTADTSEVTLFPWFSARDVAFSLQHINGHFVEQPIFSLDTCRYQVLLTFYNLLLYYKFLDKTMLTLNKTRVYIVTKPRPNLIHTRQYYSFHPATVMLWREEKSSCYVTD